MIFFIKRNRIIVQGTYEELLEVEDEFRNLAGVHLSQDTVLDLDMEPSSIKHKPLLTGSKKENSDGAAILLCITSATACRICQLQMAVLIVKNHSNHKPFPTRLLKRQTHRNFF